MGHQFAGNHTFLATSSTAPVRSQINAANSVQAGAGQSVMAYAGICLTDDIQPHSDGYFSQRSQQEIVAYIVEPAADQRGRNGLGFATSAAGTRCRS